MRTIPAEKRRILLVIAAISFCQGLQYVLSPVLGQIQMVYPQMPVDTVQMLITIPMFPSMVVSLLSGWLVLHISKKKLLLFGCLACGLPGFIPMLTDSFWMLFASRLIYGVGLGLATTLNTAVVAEHFQGQARVTAMGFQAASIGIGMMLANCLGGALGNWGWQTACWLHVIGLLGFVLIAWLLPETGHDTASGERVQLTRPVFKAAILAVLQFTFLFTFSTNIAMHIGGDSNRAGVLTGLFSATQIVAGLVFGVIARRTRQYTIPFAMGSISVGALLLSLFPSSMPALLLAAVCYGIGQGVFVPRAMCEASDAVAPASAAMASAIVTLGLNLGATLSPIICNNVTKLLFGSASTRQVYVFAAIAAAFLTILAALWKRCDPA